MVSREMVKSVVGRLERHFALLAKDEGEYREKLDDYFRALEGTDDILFNRAIDHLVDTHPYKSFPLIADIQSAIDFIRRTMTVYEPREQGCNHCQGQGIIIDPHDGLAKACACARGQKIRQGWAKHDSQHKYFRAPGRREKKRGAA